MQAQEMIRSNIIIAAAKTAAKSAPAVANDVERTQIAWDAKVAFEEEFTTPLNQFDTHLFLMAFAAEHAQRRARAFIQAQIDAFSAPAIDNEPKWPTPRNSNRAKAMIARMKAFLV